ncbi:1-deoxy-D-xylulose-5-phosphate reductoisomerase [Savagea sp. SN6]|uniref:1-deoxy-D-xylulose 5-phosphate reductoisomerase n=1 Tax=Savagea serpentis TaxID=2785297 RepID=A0A8J7G0L0_9BACL|nr:1-deoxy-D-xylulose-5-phosphate reductoisomerase [Savagea serpentis]MBF4499975.1 1-deoxy-D-xylulose-5-phosphate reductoisomerase [Savagea serpentis]
MKKISILGVTGSIGTQTLNIIQNNEERFQLVAMSAGRNIPLVEQTIERFQPKLVSVMEEADAERLRVRYPNTSFVSGTLGLKEVATYESDLLITAVVGSVGLEPTLAAIEARIPIALANKETLVAAGHIVMKRAKELNVPIIPVDSEHSALFQAMNGENPKTIRRLIITASGGSFRHLTRDELANVTVEQALAHPNWAMGNKLTIDSATMMNKGLEVIEAHHLFNLPFDQIDCVMHRESIIHSIVEFCDTSMIAQLGSPDMRVPIQYAMTYPDRIPMQEPKTLDLVALGQMNFETLDVNRFKALALAYEAGRTGGSLPTVMNAANEVAVAAFMAGCISFLQIDEMVERSMERHTVIQNPDLQTILEVDAMTRREITATIEK